MQACSRPIIQSMALLESMAKPRPGLCREHAAIGWKTTASGPSCTELHSAASVSTPGTALPLYVLGGGEVKSYSAAGLWQNSPANPASRGESCFLSSATVLYFLICDIYVRPGPARQRVCARVNAGKTEEKLWRPSGTLGAGEKFIRVSLISSGIPKAQIWAHRFPGELMVSSLRYLGEELALLTVFSP